MGRTHLSGSQALRGSRLVVKAPTTRLKRAGGYRVAPVAPRFRSGPRHPGNLCVPASPADSSS